MGTKKSRELTRERILKAAVDLADVSGMEDFTIRKLATALGVAPMNIYHYLSSKDEIVDGMVEVVFGEIELPSEDEDWKTAIRRRCLSARAALGRHPWAAPLMESRPVPGPANLGHHDAVIGCLRRGGLSIELTAHAYAILDSFVYGFAFEESTLPSGDKDMADIAAEMDQSDFLADYPHVAELSQEHVMKPGYDFGDSFEFGLDLLLEGIDRAIAGN